MPILVYLGHLDNLVKLGPSSVISLNLSFFISPTSGAVNLLFMMRFMNLFDQAFQVASENNHLYLKPNLKTH